MSSSCFHASGSTTTRTGNDETRIKSSHDDDAGNGGGPQPQPLPQQQPQIGSTTTTVPQNGDAQHSPHHHNASFPCSSQPQQQQQQQQQPCTRKLRVLVITMGGIRQEQIQNLFCNEAFRHDFAAPVFSPGVSSRSLRNRMTCLELCHQAGLLPEVEWQALRQAAAEKKLDAKNFFSCLDTVPIVDETSATGRRRIGNAADCQVHYSVELWRKAKTINRGRSVLACLLAHLMAMRTFTTTTRGQDDDNYSFDAIVEDNVRIPVHESICATRIRETLQASQAYEQATNTTCHLRYYGWLGSLENLEWIHTCHLPKRAFSSSSSSFSGSTATTTVAPFPTTQDIDGDLMDMKKKKEEQNLERLTTAMQAQSSIIGKQQGENHHDDDADDDCNHHPQPETAVVAVQAEGANNDKGGQPTTANSRPPGGTPVWGAYAYWISKQGYEHVLGELQQDVGSLLWKGKRARYYSVKPIDKILPRKIMAHFGTASVHITTCPTFFRAPMLTSKIHAKWDAGFCQSTQYQLDKFCNAMTWSDLWLTPSEQLIVQYHGEHGKWLTLGELETMQQERQQHVPKATSTTTTTTDVGAVATTDSNAIGKQPSSSCG